MKVEDRVRTLVVSWHWPPVNRASAGVLASLFQVAPPAAFQIMTRGVPEPPDEDASPCPDLPTARIRWPLADDENRGVSTWLASMWVVLRMVIGACRLHRRRSFDVVLAVYPHRYSVLAGFVVARVLGLQLAMYMHDLCIETLETRSRWKRRFWSWLDRAALRRASRVFVPTEEFAAHYRRRGFERLRVLPHCVPKDMKPAPAPAMRSTLELVYSGSVYQAHEDALACFVEAVRSMARVNVTYCTNRNRILPDDQVNWVTRAKARDCLTRAHAVIVLLGRQTPYPAEINGCFPSKIMDAVAAGRPILAIVPPGCFVERFVRGIGCGVVVTSYEADDIRAAIEVLCDSDKRQQFSEAASRAGVAHDAQVWMPWLMEELASCVREGRSMATSRDVMASRKMASEMA